MLEIRTADGTVLGTIRLRDDQLDGDTELAREYADQAVRRFGSDRQAYRALPGWSDGWMATHRV